MVAFVARLVRLDRASARFGTRMLSRSAVTSTATPLRMSFEPLSPPSPPPPATDPPKKGILTRLMDRYSILQQQDRIRKAESLFQAATFQASDP